MRRAWRPMSEQSRSLEPSLTHTDLPQHTRPAGEPGAARRRRQVQRRRPADRRECDGGRHQGGGGACAALVLCLCCAGAVLVLRWCCDCAALVLRLQSTHPPTHQPPTHRQRQPQAFFSNSNFKRHSNYTITHPSTAGLLLQDVVGRGRGSGALHGGGGEAPDREQGTYLCSFYYCSDLPLIVSTTAPTYQDVRRGLPLGPGRRAHAQPGRRCGGLRRRTHGRPLRLRCHQGTYLLIFPT